ncbi:DUF6169 family protein [Flavobacterium channae]|uniref:DUF6169 family protein n=1 Tax=Flavobacterium channae TaxID=2897181 RepID=UPI001E3F0C9E|nr:DUF6169 family protein [Flavobacterium channae]UGS22678.1 DUF6169 family protein [Flavobacterium channae]
MPNQYNYTYNEATSTYNFTTKNDIEYKIVFIVDESLDIASEVHIENIYQIIIEKITDKIEPFDALVSKTIENIITAFFANVQNSLIYICSENDDKAETRFNVFDRWYKNSTLESVTKVDNIINCEAEGNVYTIYTSLLYHNENPNIEYVMTAYQKIENILNDK